MYLVFEALYKKTIQGRNTEENLEQQSDNPKKVKFIIGDDDGTSV